MTYSYALGWGRTLAASEGVPGRKAAGHANRRRALVFLGVFALLITVGLIYDFLRPPLYRATSKLEILPASYAASSGGPPASLPSAAEASRPFLTEVQKLSSRSLLQEVATRLNGEGIDLSALGPDPVVAIQSILTVAPIGGTHVVELTATGRHPEFPAALLLGIEKTYRRDIADTFEEQWERTRVQGDDEVRRLAAAVAVKRISVDAYRARNGIVSAQRDENEALAQLQGLGKALQSASDRVNVAEGRLAALRAAAANGASVAGTRDDPALADLEKRASKAREDLENMERLYTPDYMALDPNARALRASVAELEKQLAARRATSRQAALAQAAEELAAARDAQQRLRAQIAAERQGAGQFASRFEQFKELQSELTQLEGAYRDALAHRAVLEAGERARVPSVRILEQAVLPTTPWRPRYGRDAALVLGGAFVLALLLMGIVELFNRPDPQPAIVFAQPTIRGGFLEDIGQPLGLSTSIPAALGTPERSLLGQPAALPRELGAEEVGALLRAADRSTQLAMLLILSGLSPHEALALRWGEVDRDAHVLHLEGESARDIRVNPLAAAYLAAAHGISGSQVICTAAGEPVSDRALASQFLCAAHDARLERVHEVTPEALRHTYVAFLARQGMRFSDLGQLAGPLSAEELAAYSALAPATTRPAREAVNTVFQGLEGPETV